MIRIALAALAFCLILPASADARPKKRPAPAQSETFPFFNPFQQPDLFSTTDGRRVRSINVRMRRVAGRPRAWCGWWLGQHLGMHDRSLWLARNWAKVGSPAGGPAVGAVVVWRNHVGIITGQSARGWVVKSGNDGNAVRERVRSLAGAIAFRRAG